MSINTTRARAHPKRSTITAEALWTYEAQPLRAAPRARKHTGQNYLILVEETKPAGLCTQNRSTPRAGAHPHSQKEHAESSITNKEGRCTRMTRMRMRSRYILTNRMIWRSD